MKVVPLDINSKSYLDYSLGTFQRRINVFSVNNEGKWSTVAYPGLNLIHTIASNLPCRGAVFAASQYNRIYTVHGNRVIALNTDGSFYANCGGPVLLTSSGFVDMCSNRDRTLIVDGVYGYYINHVTNAVTQIADLNFPAAPNSCTFLNSRFVVSKVGSGTFYVSQLNDPAVWTPLIYATADYHADIIHGLLSGGGRLFILGGATIDQFYPAGGNDPFEYIPGASADIGADSYYCWAYFRGSIYFVKPSANYSVWRLTNGSIEKISTPRIDMLLSASQTDQFNGFCYTLMGQDFYEIVTANDTGISYLYNISSNSWSEIISNVSGVLKEHRVRAIINPGTSAIYDPIAFDKTNGNIYRILTTIYQDHGSDMPRFIEFSVEPGLTRTFHARMRFSIEVQTGILVSSFTFTLVLNWSDDGISYNSGETLQKLVSSSQTAQRIELTSSLLGMPLATRYYRLYFSYSQCAFVVKSADLLIEEGGS